MNTFRERLWRTVRSHQILGRLHRDFWRNRARAALDRTGAPEESLVVPFDFGAALPSAATHDSVFRLSDLDRFGVVLVDAERLTDVDPRLLHSLRTAFRCAWRARTFALFVRGAASSQENADPGLRELMNRMSVLEGPEPRGFTPHRPQEPGALKSGSGIAIAVTTYERPAALSRSLPQIMALGVPVLVVDDGSRAHQAERNRTLCERHGARYLLLPENRGLPAAMNVALDYWLADPALEWISYLQDDVDVHPDLLDALRPLQDKDRAPLLTGFDAADHPTVSTSQVGPRLIKAKRTTPAVHLHAHRAYWASVMPIPTPYLGAPKPRVGASLEDWWITCHAPASVEKRGLLVPCAPGLVSTFLSHRDDSTWDNPSSVQS